MDNTLDDDFDEAVAVLYDVTSEFWTNVETIMHIMRGEQNATKEKLKEIEKMIDIIKQYNSRFLQYISQVPIK